MNSLKNKKPSDIIDTSLSKGLKYLGTALPFLFIGPVLISIGFRSIKKDNSFLLFFLGILIALVSIVIVVQGIRIILKSLYGNDK